MSFGDMLYGQRVPEATNYDSAADRGTEVYLYAGIAPAGSTPSTQTSEKKAWWNFFRRRR